jgi:hypothetical protein
VKHCSDTGHYCSALFRKGILFFFGAFAPPSVNVASPLAGAELEGVRMYATVALQYELLQFQWVWPQPQPATWLRPCY